MIICAKLYLYPTMHDKVMGWAQIGFTGAYTQSLCAECDLDL